MYSAGDVRIENVPDPKIIEPTDAVIRVTRACVCGSDLWPYQKMEHSDTGRVMGHEAIGVVEDVGADVRTIKRGDFVIMPFAFSDGTCAFCHDGLQTSCIHGGFFGTTEVAGAQAEAVRIPLADGTLFPVGAHADDALMASLLTLSDVMGTGHHAAIIAKVTLERVWPWSAMELWDCAVSLPRSDLVLSRSSFWDAMLIALHSLRISVRQTS